MWMIIIDAIILHIPTTVLTYGSNGDHSTHTFEEAYNVMEKIQMAGFCIQETTLSSIYIFQTVKILRTSLQPRTRATMKQLIVINAVIIVMDMGLLGLECASLYILEAMLKGVIYSIKLKLEFAILGKLVKFVGGTPTSHHHRQDSTGVVSTVNVSSSRHGSNLNSPESATLERDPTRPSIAVESVQPRRKSTRSSRQHHHEYEFARFEHVGSISLLRDADLDDSDVSPRRVRKSS